MTTVPLVRKNPKKIDATLKEAVTEAILFELYQRVSGEGEYGRIVLGDRPSARFISGFLQPAYIPRLINQGAGDETSNPIHVITAGMDLQVRKKRATQITAALSCAIYVRILPSQDDLRKKHAFIELNSNSKRILHNAVKEARERFDDQNKELKESDKSKFYNNRAEFLAKIRHDVLVEELGIRVGGDDIKDGKASEHEQDQVEESFGENVTAETPQSSSTDEIDRAEAHDPMELLSFEAYPGMASIIPAGSVKPIVPSQKWLRLELDVEPTLDFNIDEHPNRIKVACQQATEHLNECIQQRIDRWLQDTDPETGGKLWAYPINLVVTPDDIKNWDNFLQHLRKEVHDKGDPGLFSLPVHQIEWNVELFNVAGDPERVNVRIAVENQSEAPPRGRGTELEHALFQVLLKARMKKDSHIQLNLDRVKPSYRYNRYLRYPALGFNNGVAYKENEDDTLFRTTWMPIYNQPRISQASYAGVDVAFSSLQTQAGLDRLQALPDAFEQWIIDTKNKIDPTDGAVSIEQELVEKTQFDEDCKCWQQEADKIRAGIKLLQESAASFVSNTKAPEAIPFRAWSLMNESMAHSAKKKGYAEWRLFQVAFILAHITGFASRMKEFEHLYDEEWDESVALLYFATGGGKSEAFFGLLLFNLFFDRLRGKTFGVTALIRYPLRLLTIQQAQRLAKMLADAEVVRRKNSIKGSPFTIGFWVGGANTPNSLSSVTRRQVPKFRSPSNPSEDDLENQSEYRNAMEAWNKLPECPFCGGRTVLRAYGHKGGMVGHGCTNKTEKCEWNSWYGEPLKEPLPFLIVDDDIYDFAPAVILGTIDKLALIGHRDTRIRRIFGMFGLAHRYNKKTGRLSVLQSLVDLKTRADGKEQVELFPSYGDGERLFHDPFPSMIIQDETHLLEESLGTFSGVFETTFETMLEDLASNARVSSIVALSPGTNILRHAKVVAASATVANPERQIRQLYQRETVQFPHPGPTLYESFYALPEEPQGANNNFRSAIGEVEIRAHRARLYATIMTNGKPHTSTTVSLLANFHLLISQHLLDLMSGDLTRPAKVSRELINAIPDNPLQSIFRGAIRNASDEELATLIDMHRIALTYVTNKKGGDQIMAAEGDATISLHEDFEIPEMTYLDARLISGAVDAGGIQQVINDAEDRPAPGAPLQNPLDEDTLRSVVATSAISHGVDMDVLNSMFFAGMPSDVAEYIQASSRVGRSHVGFILLVPTPQRRRDRYILETHDIYHRFLERMIRPAAVDRWAEKALLRTMSSLMQAYLIGVRQTLQFLDLDDNQKNRIRDFGTTLPIRNLLNRNPSAFYRDLSDFVSRAIGLHHHRYQPTAWKIFESLLKTKIQDIGQDILRYDDILSLSEFFEQLNRDRRRTKEKPMTSLRDVDPAGSIYFRAPRARRRMEDGEAVEVMKILRRGYSAGNASE
jgi:hypothetical protein